jgi:excinuclease ABC subunit A
MGMLADLTVPCDRCGGSRFNPQTLQIRYRHKTIADVLDMTVAESVEFFASIEKILQPLQCMAEVGLGYLKLGQPADTLSGGEAQRVKLATQLSRRGQGHVLYLLDEPTTGLHISDIERLLSTLQQLIELDNTVVVIEHQLDVIKTADWVIDLGPEGGEHGGHVLVAGPPEDVAAHPRSLTGKFLAPYFTDSS